MSGRKKVLTSRRLAIASIIFGLFVVFDILLFGWLIFNSLSQREIEKVLLETREEAEPLAQDIADRAEELDNDLFVVMTVAEETRTYIENVLSQRELVRTIEIRDHNGAVVYDHRSLEDLPLDDAVPRVETGKSRDGFEIDVPGVPLEAVEVPIGDLGTLVIGLREEEVQKRIGVLRQDLIRQTSLIGVLTLSLLVAAFFAVWKLFHRARSLEEQALEAERMAYVGTLASGLAHEIRSPLNSLSLNMQMLEEETREEGAGGSQLRLLSLTRSELGRLERLATDFLSYAKPRPLEREPVAVADLFERVRGVLAGEVQERDGQLVIDDRSGGARVEVDRNQLNQLLLNLTQNALTSTEELERPPVVKWIARKQADRLVLEVTDNGQGIPADDQEKIFDLFFSTRKGGTGLGLAIVQRIARAHGAELEVESTVGQGTTMRLSLPVAR